VAARDDGARAVLEHFDVLDGNEGEALIAEYTARKQRALEQLIDAGEFLAYPDGLRFVVAAKHAGLRLAAASSSKNAARLMGRIQLDTVVSGSGIASPSMQPAATLLDAFDVDVSGREFLHGKPDPEMFLAAASLLGVREAAVVVIEDAVAGVLAGKAAGMEVIGIARGDDAHLLAGAGADLVVTSLDEVDRARLSLPD
jgi:beta-phosphoglucomutase-like phosphatase (HAD superfamily)